MGSRRRAQSPSSVNKTSQWQLACVFHHAHPAPWCGYKRRAFRGAGGLLRLRARVIWGLQVRASPSSTSPRASHSSSTSHRLVYPDECAGSSDRAGPSISFGALADDGKSIAASGDELGSGEDDSAELPPSGRVALPESDPELIAMLSRAAESIGLHYRPPPSPERSRLDD